MTPLFIGGLLRGIFEKRSPSDTEAANRRERGVLLGSGFVGGEGLLGVGIAGVAFVQNKKPDGIGTGWLGAPWIAELAGLAAFAVQVYAFTRLVHRDVR
jgi:hypothetical protein